MEKQQPKNQPPWEVEFYIAENGKSPAAEFFNGLSTEEKADAIKYLRLLRDRGIELRYPVARKIRGYSPLWELRPFPNRFVYFLHTGRRFIILHGFPKEQQKSEANQYKTARKRYYDFLEREK